MVGYATYMQEIIQYKLIKFPFNASAERLFRDDDLYDIVCVINYNTKPILPGKGSAIFLHICKDDYSQTEGCVAIKKDDLIRVSKHITDNSSIIIEG